MHTNDLIIFLGMIIDFLFSTCLKVINTSAIREITVLTPLVSVFVAGLSDVKV